MVTIPQQLSAAHFKNAHTAHPVFSTVKNKYCKCIPHIDIPHIQTHNSPLLFWDSPRNVWYSFSTATFLSSQTNKTSRYKMGVDVFLSKLLLLLMFTMSHPIEIVSTQRATQNRLCFDGIVKTIVTFLSVSFAQVQILETSVQSSCFTSLWVGAHGFVGH